jgi:hypothetical protein
MSGLTAPFWRHHRVIRNLALGHASVSKLVKVLGYNCRSCSFGVALIFVVRVFDLNLRLVRSFCSGLFSSSHFVKTLNISPSLISPLTGVFRAYSCDIGGTFWFWL